jgi:hypothetical protein
MASFIYEISLIRENERKEQKMMLKKKLLLLCISSIFLSSCEVFNIPLDTMRPPKLTDQQERIKEAILEQLPANSRLVDPLRNDSSLPLYNMVDLDGDNKEEVIIFHKNPPQYQLLYASIFKEISNEWIRINTLDISTKDMDKVIFEDITNDGHTDIVLGKEENEEKHLFVYQLVNNDQVTKVLETPYKELAIEDLDNDGKAELYTLAFEKQSENISQKRKRKSLFINQYAFDGTGLSINQQQPVRPIKNVDYYLQSGTIASNKKGIVLHTYQSNDYMNIYHVQNGEFVAVSEKSLQPFQKALFPIEVKDINNDGVLEFATSMLETEQTKEQYFANPTPIITGYYQWDGMQTFQLIDRYYHEDSRLYDFKLPKNWTKQLKVVQKEKQVSFIDETTQKILFNIQTIPLDKWEEKQGTFILGQTKNHVFVSSFPVEKYKQNFQIKE